MINSFTPPALHPSLSFISSLLSLSALPCFHPVWVHDWVTLLCRRGLLFFTPSSLTFLSSTNPSLRTCRSLRVCWVFFVRVLSRRLTAVYYFAFPSSWLLSFSRSLSLIYLLPATAIIYLLGQSRIFFPSPISYSLILSDFIMLTQEKAPPPVLRPTATHLESVFPFVCELWCVRCTCEAAMQKNRNERKMLRCATCLAFATRTNRPCCFVRDSILSSVFTAYFSSVLICVISSPFFLCVCLILSCCSGSYKGSPILRRLFRWFSSGSCRSWEEFPITC